MNPCQPPFFFSCSGANFACMRRMPLLEIFLREEPSEYESLESSATSPTSLNSSLNSSVDALLCLSLNSSVDALLCP